jgi:hypothetical protein
LARGKTIPRRGQPPIHTFQPKRFNPAYIFWH